MGINAQNQQQVIAHIVKLTKDLRLLRQSDNIGVNMDGENELALRALTHFDVSGKFDVHDLADIVQQIRTDYPTYRDDFPHFDDQQLKWLDSLDAINEASSEKIKRFMQPTAIDSGLYQRFNDRVGWLKENNVRRPKVDAVQEAAKPLTPKEQAAAKVKAEIDAIKTEIDAATKGYTNWAIRQREKLHARFAELLADMPRAKFFDRYGSQEWLTGWPAVQRIIREEIRDKDSPIR